MTRGLPAIRGPGPMLSGRVAVSHSQETATRFLIGAFVGGALGIDLRVVSRERQGVTFRASTASALALGPTAGRLLVLAEDGETVVDYRLAFPAAVVAGIMNGLLGGVIVRALFAGFGDVTVFHAVLPGLAIAVGWGMWVVRRSRRRVETFLHNLRYMS